MFRYCKAMNTKARWAIYIRVLKIVYLNFQFQTFWKSTSTLISNQITKTPFTWYRNDIHSGMSFLPQISSYCIDMIKLTGSASREVLAHVVLLCARSDTHALLAPNYKEQQQIMISFNFQSVWVFGELNPSPRSRVFTSTSLDCSPHSCLFSSVIARLAVQKNRFKMWQRI